MSLVTPSRAESLAEIEARYTRQLPFIDDRGQAVKLVGDCAVEVKNITANSLTIQLGPKPVIKPEQADVEVPIEPDQTSESSEPIVEVKHSRGSKVFADGLSPKKMIIGGIGSTVFGASMIGGGYAVNAVARAANTNSTSGSDGGTDNASISGAMFLAGTGLTIGGLYNVFRGAYRWVTGSAMTAEMTTALDAVKSSAEASATAKFRKV